MVILFSCAAKWWSPLTIDTMLLLLMELRLVMFLGDGGQRHSSGQEEFMRASSRKNNLWHNTQNRNQNWSVPDFVHSENIFFPSSDYIAHAAVSDLWGPFQMRFGKENKTRKQFTTNHTQKSTGPALLTSAAPNTIDSCCEKNEKSSSRQKRVNTAQDCLQLSLIGNISLKFVQKCLQNFPKRSFSRITSTSEKTSRIK